MFNKDKVQVIYVLGGPGSGKGTNCDRLVKDHGFTHLSAGELLRQEQDNPESKRGQEIAKHIVDGTIVPLEITVELLHNAMRKAMRDAAKAPDAPDDKLSGKFLIDGFPRKMDQALYFDKTVIPAKLVLYLEVKDQEILLERLLERGKTSGRSDDNRESILKRFNTFKEVCMPVIDYYNEIGKLKELDASKSLEDVYKEISGAVKPLVEPPVKTSVEHPMKPSVA